MADNEQNEQTVAGGGAASANSKKCDMLFLAGMILMTAAYLLPFYFGVYLYDMNNVSKGTIYHRFNLPVAFWVIMRIIRDIGQLTDIFELVAIVSAIVGLIANFVIKNERRRYITRAVCSALVFISVAAWYAVWLSPHHRLSSFGLFYLLEISGAVCALISLINLICLYIKQNAAAQSASASSEVSSEEVVAPALNSASVSAPAFDLPISMWGYFGYEILYSIPILGQIVLIYNALAAKNRNVKNFARSYFCLLIVVAIVIAIAVSKMGMSSAFGRGW